LNLAKGGNPGTRFSEARSRKAFQEDQGEMQRQTGETVSNFFKVSKIGKPLLISNAILALPLTARPGRQQNRRLFFVALTFPAYKIKV
jgi:hypothetical protein